MSQEGYWVYVLRNEAEKFYIGISHEPTQRLKQHNAGYSTFTRKHRPWQLVWEKGPRDRLSLCDGFVMTSVAPTRCRSILGPAERGSIYPRPRARG